MFNFHWLARENYSIENLIELSNELEAVGYYSVLLTYHSNTPDSFIKIPHIINKNHKIKYMIAIRPHSISPEYLKMQCDGFKEIQDDRLIINFVAGNLLEDESTPVPTVDRILEKMDLDSRRDHLNKFLEIFKGLPGDKPEIAISGSSEKILVSAEEYADALIVELFPYINKYISSKNINKKIVKVTLCIRETKEEIDEIFKNKTIQGLDFEYSGTKDEVMGKILKLHDIGIRDIMVSAGFGDLQKHRIHDLIKDLKEIK
jgi:alkanesulfonate monooxygenase SsuD/methylene tetrahydromethanopterin reductase-like flavin-dependent oxidoreductase (luciferase family)